MVPVLAFVAAVFFLPLFLALRTLPTEIYHVQVQLHVVTVAAFAARVGVGVLPAVGVTGGRGLLLRWRDSRLDTQVFSTGYEI